VRRLTQIIHRDSPLADLVRQAQRTNDNLELLGTPVSVRVEVQDAYSSPVIALVVEYDTGNRLVLRPDQ